MLSPAQSAFNTSQSFIENALEMFVKPASLGAEGYYDRKCMCHSARGRGRAHKVDIYCISISIGRKIYLCSSVCLPDFISAR